VLRPVKYPITYARKAEIVFGDHIDGILLLEHTESLGYRIAQHQALEAISHWASKSIMVSIIKVGRVATLKHILFSPRLWRKTVSTFSKDLVSWDIVPPKHALADIRLAKR